MVFTGMLMMNLADVVGTNNSMVAAEVETILPGHLKPNGFKLVGMALTGCTEDICPFPVLERFI